MFFRSPLVFAIVGAISASLMALLGGAIVLGVYRGLVHCAVVPLVTHINGFTVVALALAVFALMLPIEAMYARRRTLFNEDAPSSAKSTFLLFPVVIAVIVCSSVIDWRRGSE